MRELSLHILDLIENSARAGASQVGVTVAESRANNALEIVVEDDGRGFEAPPERVLDPFYTTKPGHRTGLGLPLFAATVEQSGGQLSLANARPGAQLRARMQLDHIDRPPLGDLAATLSMVSLTHPEIDLACTLRAEGREKRVRSSETAASLPEAKRNPMGVAMQLAEDVRRALRQVGVTA